jgi:hypothetical protein
MIKMIAVTLKTKGEGESYSWDDFSTMIDNSREMPTNSSARATADGGTNGNNAGDATTTEPKSTRKATPTTE